MFSYLVVKDALDRTRNVQFSEQINKRHITTFAVSTGALALLLLGGLYLSTLYLPYGIARLTANVLKAPHCRYACHQVETRQCDGSEG